MMRILAAAVILLLVAYFYLNQDEATEALSPEARKVLEEAGESVPLRPEGALQKAREVEQQMQAQAKKLQEEIDKQSGDDAKEEPRDDE